MVQLYNGDCIDVMSKILDNSIDLILCDSPYTDFGETVLDNCMGSGSIGVACVNTDRNFVGIEIDSDMFEIAKNRINSQLIIC